MILAASLTFALVVPQLRVDPDRPVVGHELVLRGERDGSALAALEITVELPDGSRQAIGATGADGALAYVPSNVGPHVFRAEVDDLLLVAPCRVVPARSRWLVGAVCVPLGLALLWRSLSRARDRRDQ